MQAKASDYSILIVDDTPLNLSLIVDYLTQYGFTIRVARSGEMALKRVAYDPPSLILLDVVMPGLDGFETCRRLKANPATRHIPVIFMTALANSADKVRGFEVGAVDYVTKPLQQEEVLARITTHLRLHDLTRSLQEQNELLEARSQLEKARLLEAVNQQKEQLQRLNMKLTQVQEKERQKLARELHDEMGQSLTAISMDLTAVSQQLPADTSPFVRERLAEAMELTEQTLERMRELSLNLHPPMLDDLGLVPTLRWYINRYARRVSMEASLETIGAEQRLPPEIETTIYRVLQEALTNVARHAAASRVRVQLEWGASGITVSIEDNGRGFDLNATLTPGRGAQGLGLLGMQERISLAGGLLHMDSEPGKGTSIRFTLPYPVRQETPVSVGEGK
jgi:signal transduction histidine kinase